MCARYTEGRGNTKRGERRRARGSEGEAARRRWWLCEGGLLGRRWCGSGGEGGWKGEEE